VVANIVSPVGIQRSHKSPLIPWQDSRGHFTTGDREGKGRKEWETKGRKGRKRNGKKHPLPRK